VRLTIFRRGEERWSVELNRSLSREDEVAIAIHAMGCDECDEPGEQEIGCSCRTSKKPPFGFSR
jgi:hypothetical protein